MNIFEFKRVSMAYSGLLPFIKKLEEINELRRIRVFADPVLEITEITDRITKSENSPALLFEKTGTSFPLLINAFGSDRRMALAMGRDDLEEAGREIDNLFRMLTNSGGSIAKKLSSIPDLVKIARILPSKSSNRGKCQQTINRNPDLGILPVLKCWPYDGGRFITLPIVHTRHPETGSTNAGMYRMQILDNNTTAMHWQRHKTGANHYEAWKLRGEIMPVSVALGGDPVYTYAATAPLPENVSEYILAGFLRKKKVKLVKCITNDLYVPDDADIIIEGYVDPSEEPVWEGPFGDHTGFYSLADWYPKFHVTCITHARNAVYPATIVGIPPQEDAMLAKATEKIFLSPVKLALQPEVIDFHLPEAGVAHNLAVIRIDKKYPGQGMKVISSILGAGQMMFSKYVIVVSGEVDIRNYGKLTEHVFANTDFRNDLMFIKGPLDVLDHSSDRFSFGGKAGLDATIKLPEERTADYRNKTISRTFSEYIKEQLNNNQLITEYNTALLDQNIPILIISVDRGYDKDVIEKNYEYLTTLDPEGLVEFIITVDYTVDVHDIFICAWQLLGNSDPLRDHKLLPSGALFIDGTIKAFRRGGFPRKWPNIVCSDEETINTVDSKWGSYGLGEPIASPSVKYRKMIRKGKDEITVDNS
jgi:4-hydroxy-3-polyprenylbenzoate decarboxylase